MKPQLHLNKTHPDKHYFDARTDPRHNFEKPFYGLWTSTYIDEHTGSDWVRWCAENHYCNVAQQTWLLTSRPDARVYTINSYRDWSALARQYRYHWDVIPDMVMVDWERITEDYDAVHLTESGMSSCRRPGGLYSWDCESTVWLRPGMFSDVVDLGEVLYPITLEHKDVWNDGD